VVEASARAYLNATNKVLFAQRPSAQAPIETRC
jgi:hypothetical protein